MLRLLSILACALAVVPLQALSSQAEKPGCLSYHADSLHMTGVLRRHTYPGQPNYESVASGDAAETGFYLHLARPVCARGYPSGDGDQDPTEEPVDGVRLVQLVLDSAGYAGLRPLLGRRVTVTGQLMSAHTGHHHAPLLLIPAAGKSAITWRRSNDR